MHRQCGFEFGLFELGLYGWLGQHSDRRKTAGNQFIEWNDCEFWCPGKQNAQGVGGVHSAYSTARAGFCPATFRCFSSFFATMRRFSGDR